MEILIKATQLILSLSILVILHELGHFIPAKLFKTKVEKFYLFFDPWFSLFKFKKGDTEYGIGWLPLGGYVKISGMIDESMDKEQMKQEPQPWEFRSKPAWQRLIIMVGGVTVNFILAVVIYSMISFVWGEKTLPAKNITDGVWVADSMAINLGFKTGDKVLAMDGQAINTLNEVMSGIMIDDKKTITVKRDTVIIDINIPADFTQEVLKRGDVSSLFIPRFPFIVGGFAENSAAEKAGIMKKDRIVGLNEMPIKYFDEFSVKVKEYKNQEITVKVLREGEMKDIKLTVPNEGLIGVAIASLTYEDLEKLGIYEFQTVHYSFMQSIPEGINRGKETLTKYIKQFKLVFSAEGAKQVGGFVAIGNLFGAQWDWQHFWEMTALLSIMLAFMNILPIPALDGGHVMFLLYEVITGKKPNEKFMEYAQYAGMILLLSLLLFANGNDIFKHFIK